MVKSARSNRKKTSLPDEFGVAVSIDSIAFKALSSERAAM